MRVSDDEQVVGSAFDGRPQQPPLCGVQVLRLVARLAAIPEQREREEKALRRRYADPTTRWFPVAVTLLVPSAIARGASS